MTVNVNNQTKSIVDNSTLKALLEQLNLSADGIAIAINNEIIVKGKWGQTQIHNNDHITIIQATQGG
ncbi:sulfur carrier protein ThiS [Aquimarina sp. RZ0]|uniref:sulfur carrier protein ThiS n=1 Tax=Aquimarina sp. RZ0 TaxID=2607730 RepID=UPI0011F2B093|nr:sulfur carrier protein ThiS [Aquimarina sp. RZ0]KAA1243774.1 sulfur carrier protein ThiS [Aquimarina sp. RZ0]